MLSEALDSEKVDEYPISAFPPKTVDILDFRKGHLVDPGGIHMGFWSKDSSGKKWRIFETREGIFKSAH